MLYNGEEINLIKRLIDVGLIKEKVEETPNENLENITGNTVNVNQVTNEVSGIVENKNTVNN